VCWGGRGGNVIIVQKSTYTHTHTYVDIYIYISSFVLFDSSMMIDSHYFMMKDNIDDMIGVVSIVKLRLLLLLFCFCFCFWLCVRWLLF